VIGFDTAIPNECEEERSSMNREFSTSRGAIMGLALCSLAVMPAVAATPEAPFATMGSAGSSLYWTTEASSGELVLSVNGPGFEMRQVSAPGESPSVTLTRGDGDPLLDGLYKWEIRESFPGVNDGVYDPANGRDGAGSPSTRGPVAIRGRVDSGVFTIRNGFVVDGTASEAAEPANTAGADKESN
jgi:hypothetical protein